jgi:hypothetical protein
MAHLCVMVSGGECFPRRTTVVVVTQSAQRCDTTALVGTPCAASALAPPPLEVTSGTFVDASWHFGHDMGMELPGAAFAAKDFPLLCWSLSPPLTCAGAELAARDTATTAKAAMRMFFVVFMF